MRLLIIVLTLLLPGCFTSSREENTATVREETRVGVEGGKATNVHTITREQTETQAKASAGVDVDAAIKAAVAAASGNLSDVIAAIKPVDLSPIVSRLSAMESKPPATATDWAGLAAAAGGALLAAGGPAVVLHGKAKAAEARAHAANERAISYAERVDPGTAGTYRTTDTKSKPL